MSERFELSIDDPSYPEPLRDLPDPPKRLYGIGDPALLIPGLAVIGSRKATPYGLRCADIFAGWAASKGIVIVSGAAMGCDQKAHQAALEAEGPTIAILGCGADVDYPKRGSRILADIRSVGLVLSEAPWGSPPQRFRFSRRNRLIAALSAAVLVVEASLPSGTFGTAKVAEEIGRTLLAVPGSIFAPECRGTNRLLSEGACPVSDVSELAGAIGVLELRSESAPPASSSDDTLARALIADPMRPDDVARALNMDIVDVARHLGRLEREGIVAKYADGRYGPC